MTTTAYSVDADNLADTPTQNGLVTQMNAILAPLLTTSIENASFTAQKEGRTLGNAYKLDFVGVSGASAMANPFTIQAFIASTDAALVALVDAYALANPSAFVSQIFKQYLRAPRAVQQVVGLVFVNPVYADGSSHFAGGGSGGGGGPPTGAAGGDLSGTYPNPIVGPITNGVISSGALSVGANTLAARPLGTATSIVAEITLRKGSTTFYQTIFSCNENDGTTPSWGESGIVIGPPSGGTFDCPLSATISGGNLNIIATPATTGWSAETRIREFV